MSRGSSGIGGRSLPGLPVPSCGCLTEHQGHAAPGRPSYITFTHRIRRIIYLSPTLETALNPKSISFNTGQKLKSTEQPSTDSPAQTQREAPQGYGRRQPASTTPTTPSYLLLALRARQVSLLPVGVLQVSEVAGPSLWAAVDTQLPLVPLHPMTSDANEQESSQRKSYPRWPKLTRKA